MTSAATKTFNASFMKAFGALTAEPTFTTDSKGRKVRVFTKDAPLSREIVRHFYLYNRCVEIEDILENIGENGLAHALKSGYLKPCALSKGRFWITKACAKNYDLPNYRLLGGARAVFID